MKIIRTILMIAVALGWVKAQAALDSKDQDFITAMCQSTNIVQMGGANWTMACIGVPVGNNSDEVIPDYITLSPDKTRIQKIELGVNLDLSGQLPMALGNLDELTVLTVETTDLGDSLPSSIGNLKKLKHLTIDGKKFRGRLPTSLGNLAALESLTLKNTEFYGKIPATIGQLQALKTLKLHGNNFSGQLPTSLGNLTNLERLDLSENTFSGSLPVTIGNMAQLSAVDLSYNRFSGTLPDSLGNLSKLQTLNLEKNTFSGDLPKTLGKLTELQSINLSQNKFSGQLPAYLNKWSKLSSLKLSDNNMSGNLPATLASLASLEVLLLDKNQFTGEVPSFLGSKVCYLWIENNNFTFADILSKHPSNSSHFKACYGSYDRLYRFSPQGSIDKNRSGYVGEIFRANYRRHADDRIQWYRAPSGAGIALGGETNLTFAPMIHGNYFYTVTNPKLPNLTLTSQSISVSYRVGGRASGFCSGLCLYDPATLLLNGKESLLVGNDGLFYFTTELANNDAYEVTIKQQPSTRDCTLKNGTGTINYDSATNVILTCVPVTPSTRTIGGKTTGLCSQFCGQNPVALALESGSGSAAQTESLKVTKDGEFTFKTLFHSTTTYRVTITKQPRGKTCTVSNGSGTIHLANISDVVITCRDTLTQYTVGGQTTGLLCASLICQRDPVTLLLNGKEALTTFDFAFAFKTKLNHGEAYDVTIKTQPHGKKCRIENGKGTINASNVTNIQVKCQAKPKPGWIFSDSFEKP